MTAELQTINIETASAKIFKDASQNLKLLSAYSCVLKELENTNTRIRCMRVTDESATFSEIRSVVFLKISTDATSQAAKVI